MYNNIKKYIQIVLVETLIVFDRISSFQWRYATRLGWPGAQINSQSLTARIIVNRLCRNC